MKGIFKNKIIEDKDKKIEQLQKELESSKASWMRYFEETEVLKAELSMYKKLCKVQSEVINGK